MLDVPEAKLTKTNELLEEILSNLNNGGNIEASAVVSRDGLLINANIPEGVKADTFAAMAATMLGAAETATLELDKGLPNRVIVESKNGRLVCMGSGPRGLLVILSKSDTSLGLILVELEKAASLIKDII
ncbi:MAG: roadblock/LC7 domain-containing protein [Nitrospirae bacterium]|nr:roadblock/LC7 domain-containing protein [Nitrospirota bacterium]